MGRIEGRQPDFDLQSALSTELGRFDQSEFQREAERCGQLMVTKGQELNKMGRHLQGLSGTKS